jgi:hypothetical protein
MQKAGLAPTFQPFANKKTSIEGCTVKSGKNGLVAKWMALNPDRFFSGSQTHIFDSLMTNFWLKVL